MLFVTVKRDTIHFDLLKILVKFSNNMKDYLPIFQKYEEIDRYGLLHTRVNYYSLTG